MLASLTSYRLSGKCESLFAFCCSKEFLNGGSINTMRAYFK